MNVGQSDPEPEVFWVGSAHPFDLHEAYLCFRSPAWHLKSIPLAAVLDITADSRYKLWVNGQFLSRGPARSYPQAQTFDQIDLRPFLQIGKNILAVQVYQPGYSHFSYLHRGTAGLFCRLICDGESLLVTDPNWRVRRDFSFAEQVPRVSIYSSGVEERDNRLVDNWHALEYDDAAWEAARIAAGIGTYPWTSLRPRSLPLLREREIPLTLIETRRGNKFPGKDTDAHVILREGWYAAAPGGCRSENGWYATDLRDQECAFWLFDLGRDYTCQGWAEIEGATGAERMSISYQEKIRAGELVISDPQTYCRVRLTDRFYLRPGKQRAETFALRGGRYLVFQVTGPTGPDFRWRPHALISEYPIASTRALPPADPQLTAIMQLCEETFKACLQDGFVDCVWRESSQWLGDALPQSLIMSVLGDDIRPLRRIIEMAAQGAYPDGVLPSVTPGEVHAYAVVDYNFMWVELLRLYWRLTADAEFTLSMWPVLVKMLNRFAADVDETGLIFSQPGRRLFLDWSAQSRREPNAVYNLHYIWGLQQAAALAHHLGIAGEAVSAWQERIATGQSACRAAFWQHGRWYDDPQQSTYSQLAAALAVLTETADPSEIDPLLTAVAQRSLDLNDEPDADKMALASPFKHHYLFEAMRKGGKYELVVEIIRQRWAAGWRAAFLPPGKTGM